MGITAEFEERTVFRFADALERIINVLALGQFGISTALLCFSGFQITLLQRKSPDGGGKSGSVGDSAYSSGWTGSDFTQDLQIMMMRSRNPCVITAAKFYNMSFESFSAFLIDRIQFTGREKSHTLKREAKTCKKGAVEWRFENASEVVGRPSFCEDYVRLALPELNVTGSKVVVHADSCGISLTNLKVSSSKAGDSRERTRRYGFDYCFDSSNPEDENYADQAKIYRTLGHSVLDAIFSGYNSCLVAYGQSASGKTYTMMGTKEEPGLTPRLCAGIFSRIEEERKNQTVYRVFVR
ncbi:hypothetical protein KM043_001869 [Ampulex compressa]|nr:hypothetical protein KM043_001869 [Ampulex compressa]